MQALLPPGGDEGEMGGEGQMERSRGIDPLILTFLSSTPGFWFGESFIPPVVLCIGAGRQGGV